MRELCDTDMPWFRAEGKTSYNVWETFLSPKYLHRTKTPIKDKEYLRLLEQRAGSYSISGQPMKIDLALGAVIDVGGPDLASASSVAYVNIDKSPQLERILAAKLRVTPKTAIVSAFLLSSVSMLPAYSRDQKGLFYGYRDQLLVNVTWRPSLRSQSYVFSENEVELLYDSARFSPATKAERETFVRLVDRRPTPNFDGYRRVLAKNGQGDFEWRTLALQGELVRLDETAKKKYRVISDFAVKGLIGSQQAEQAREWTIEQAAQYLPLVVGGVSLVSPLLEIGTSDESQPSPESTLRYGPPEGFESWACNTFCTQQECKNCCNMQYGAELLAIGGIAASCHGASDFCPWCHVGCGIAEAILLVAASITFAQCKGNCTKQFTEDSPGAAPCGEGVIDASGSSTSSGLSSDSGGGGGSGGVCVHHMN